MKKQLRPELLMFGVMQKYERSKAMKWSCRQGTLTRPVHGDSSWPSGYRKGTSHRRVLWPVSGKKRRESQSDFLASWYSQTRSASILSMSRCHAFGQCVLSPVSHSWFWFYLYSLLPVWPWVSYLTDVVSLRLRISSVRRGQPHL